MSSNDIAIRVSNLSKCYQLYDTPRDRLKQFVLPQLRRMTGQAQKQYSREFWSLRDISFEVKKGETLGIIGKNGAGKSTLLQILCGTLAPTSGTVETNGRVAALLELGAGFNPEFTGRENVFMSAAIMGFSQEEIAARYEDIVEFSGIRDFIDQPVKTYSSGMYVRLAFSVAISVDPDILVIDEALSVGDGEFSRKSFDRIMELKNSGKTILFCSHSMYQVEAICSQVVWLHQGRVEMLGYPPKVIASYSEHLDCGCQPETVSLTRQPDLDRTKAMKPNSARIKLIEVAVDGVYGRRLQAVSGESEIVINVSFTSDPALPPPVVALGFETNNGQIITSAFTNVDGVTIDRTPDGQGRITACFPQFPLLKGAYWLGVVLMCENGIYFYDSAMRVVEIDVIQASLMQGLVSLPHEWT